MGEIVIAGARLEDVAALLPLLAAQLDEHGMGMPQQVLEEALSGIVTRPERGRVFAAWAGDPVVGVAVMPYTWTVEHGGRCAWLDELYVLPEMRGRGVGTRLLAAAMALAREDGCLAMDLEVDVDHARVETLYLRHGFRSLPRRRFSRRLVAALESGDGRR
jgi:GNAT superfamily N-acetyltransferase